MSKAIYKGVRFECYNWNSTFTNKVKIKGHVYEIHEGVKYDFKYTQQGNFRQDKLSIYT